MFFVRRERDLTRFYIQLTTDEDDSLDRDSVTLDFIIDRIRRRLSPYTVSEWLSCLIYIVD